MREQVEEMLRTKLQELEKEKLVDMLIDIFITYPPFAMIDAFSVKQPINNNIIEQINKSNSIILNNIKL